MKKLNQNNTIATTAMLTKTNTMKNKMNFFAKVVMMVVLMLLPQMVWGQQAWKQYGGTWYILYIPETDISGNSLAGAGITWDEDWNGATYNVYTPSVQPTNCDYSARIHDKATNWPNFNISYGEENKTVPGGSKSCHITFVGSAYCTDWRSFSFTMPSGKKTVAISMTINGCTKKKSIKLSVPLPHHTDFESDKPTSYEFDDTQIGNTSVTTVNFTDFFKSFYTTNAITATITGDDAQYFHLPNNASSIIIANTNSVYAKASCFADGLGDAGSLNTSSANVTFTPNAARPFSAKLTITYDGGTFDIELGGTGTAKTPTFNWKIDDIAVGENIDFGDVVGIQEPDAIPTSLSIIETNQDGSALTGTSKLAISGGIITGVATGTTYIKATFMLGNSDYTSPISDVHELTISQNELVDRSIVWNADFTSFRDDSQPINLSSSEWKAAWEATSPQGSGDVDCYTIANPTIATISGNTLTIHSAGVTTITATKNADATYKKATMTKTLVVSSSSGCNTLLVNQSPNTRSDFTSLPFNGRPKKVFWTVVSNDRGSAEGTVSLQTIEGTTIDFIEVKRDNTYPKETDLASYPDVRQFKVTGLRDVEGLEWGTRTLTSFQVIMASYLEPIANNSISFGEHDNFSESALIPNIANYANLPGNINVEIVDVETGGNNTWDCFKFSDNSHASSVTTGGCGVNNQGTASVTIKFVPKQIGEHKARLKVSAYDGNSENPVTFYIPITGTGRKITQTLTWNNNPTHPIFTGTYNALSNNVNLTDAAKTSGETTQADPLTIIYSSSNTAVADVVTNGGIQYIDFKTAGIFRLRANCAGNNVYSDAAQIESDDINVALVDAELVINPISDPYVFSTITPTLQTKTTDASTITYTYKDNNGTTLTTGASYKLPSVNAVKVIATTSATTVYKASTSEAITVRPQAVTPTITFNTISGDAHVGTPFTLNGANWKSATKTPAQPAKEDWTNEQVDIYYTSDLGSVADDGVTLTSTKAGYATITAKIDAADNHTASDNQPTKGLKIDFATDFVLTCTGAIIGTPSTTILDMSQYFESSGNYTVSSSSTEFVVTKQNNSNYITIQFSPTSVNNGDSDTEEKEATITITDNGQEYHFKVKATAEKKDAGLTLEYIGETFAFSTITLSHSEATDAEVTLSASIGNITDNTYKFQSTAPVTITATVLANNKFKADSKTLNFTPKAVKPKITGWSGNYGAQKVGVSCPLGQADWDVDETVSGQPAKTEWSTDEVTITYTSSESRIAEVSGSNLVFHRAGLATITASIAEEKNHNASTNNPSKSVKVDFADEGVNCGTAYAGETPAVADITDMIVPAGALSDLSTNASSDNTDFKVIVNNDRLEVRFDPSSYHEETSTAIITFTDTDGEVYNLNVQGECQKHTPVIEWRSDVQTIAIAQDENDIKTETDLIDATNSQYYQPLKFKSGDVSKVKVYDENYEEAEWGVNLYAIGKGAVTIYAMAEETANHYASTEASEKQFTVIGEAKSKIAWNQNFLRIYNDQGSIPLTAEVQASSNSAPITGATVTYHLLEVQNNVVTLDGCTLKITAGATGTAKIYAEFAGDDDYIGCVSETLNIRVIARPIGGMCEPIHYDDVTLNPTTYYFNKNMTSAGEPYFEVEKVEYYYYVKGDNGEYEALGRGEASSRTITATFGTQTQNATGTGGANAILPWNRGEGKTDENYYTFNAKSNENPQSISFTGDINKNGSKFTEIKVTPKSYFRENTDFSNPFAGSDTKVDEETTRTLELGKYSNLSEYTIQLWDYELNQAYSGGEFSIIDGGSSDHYPDGCNDYGDWIITVKFKPISGKPEKVHKCKIQITYKRGTDGSNGNYNGFEIEANASRHTQPDIIWNQDLSGLTSLSTQPTGNDWTSKKPIELTAKSGLSEPDYYGEHIAVDSYEITAGTDVAEVNGDQLSIKKAGQFTIKAIHNGDDKYEPTSKERTIDIALSEPTIELSHNGTPIAENETINVTYNDPSITIDSKALYGDFEIYGYTIESGKIELSSSALDVVSIANDNQLQFLKSGDAVITATITEDDVVSSKTFTFYVHVNKAQAGLHWDDVTKYANDWIYVFETKSMTALADNNDNNGAISYDVTSGKASFSGNNITINGYGSITARAIIATTDKYLADTITNTFTPKMVTPVVSWSGSDFSTNLSNTPYTLTDEATVAASYGEPDVSVWTDGKTVVYSSTTPEVATLKQDNTFELHKVGYATIQAKVEAGDNNYFSNVEERYLKVDFDPDSVRNFGTVSTYDSKTININLGEEMKRLGVIYVSNISNGNFSCGEIQDDILPITFKPRTHDSENPEQTAEITIYDPGSNQDYHLYVKGTTKLFTPTVTYNNTKHNNWVFTTKPNPSVEDIRYSSDDDIYCLLPGNISAAEEKTANGSITLSLLNPETDAEYVTISNDGKKFTVNYAKTGDDDPFTVYLVATYPGLTGMMEEDTLHIPITIQKSEQIINWIDTETIYASQTSKQILAPTLGITGGDASIEYSYNPEGVVSIGAQTGNYIILNLLNKRCTEVEITASIESDKYSKGCSANPLTITINKLDQYVDWDGSEINNGFDTQKRTDEGIVLNGIAKYTTIATGANIKYNVVEVSNYCGDGDLILLVEDNEVSPRQTTLYYSGNGSGTITIEAIAEATDEYNATVTGTQPSPRRTFTISKVDCDVNDWTISDMHYGDKVTLTPSVDKFTRGENYEYTLPPVTGELTTDGNVLEAKGVGSNLTILAKKLEDCWVNESATSTASNQFNILKSKQMIEWDKKPLGTLQSDGAYHFSVFDDGTYQLATQAIDTLHSNADDTWLTLVNDKYVTANIINDAPDSLPFTYGIIEGSDVCKSGENTGTIVSVDSEGKLHITGNGTGTVQIVASVDGGDYYENVAENITVVVDKAPRTIVWNNTSTTSVTTASTDITLDAHSVYDSETISTDDEGTKTYSISTGGENYVEIEEGVLKIKDNISLPDEDVEITVNVSFANSCRYADKAYSWTFTLKKENIEIQNAPTENLTFDDLTSTTDDFDLKSVLISSPYNMTTNYPEGKYSYSFNSCNTDIATIDKNGKITAFDSTATGSPLEIIVTATEAVTGSSDSKTIKVVITRGTLIFNIAAESGDNKWTNPANWSRPDITQKYIINVKKDDLDTCDFSKYDVLIADSCFIGKDPTREDTEPEDETEWETHKVAVSCNNLTIDGTNAKLVIGEASTLNVKGNLMNNDSSKLVLTANYWGQASVVFNSGSPNATIEMYVPEGNGSRTSPIWQYRGICVDGFAAVDGPWECMAIYQWNEADNADLDHGCWNVVTNGGGGKENIHLSPWIGYGFANICSDDDRKAENWLTYSGTLINSSTHEFGLTKNDDKTRDDGTLYENCGVNLITNSYVAPVTINTVNYGDANATVTFYNAGTHADWEEYHAGADTLGEYGKAGQMTVCPKNTSKEAHAVVSIPAGQSFFVTANSDGDKVKFSYDSIITDLGPSRRMFLPGERESEYNVLGIRVKGKENGDRLVLLECETCTRQYDNGYDGYKMPGNEGLPQIYAYNKFGNTAVNADSTLNKQYVGFMAGSDDETYTISFETDKLFGYHSLYLTDRKLNETVDILAGETYQFKGYTVGENMRFQINGITEQEWNNENDDDDDNDDSNVCDLRIVGNTLYVQGFTTDHYPAARVELFDMTGNLVWSTPLTSERLYDLPQLPQGIYTVRLGDCHVKYVTK